MSHFTINVLIGHIIDLFHHIQEQLEVLTEDIMNPKYLERLEKKRIEHFGAPTRRTSGRLIRDSGAREGTWWVFPPTLGHLEGEPTSLGKGKAISMSDHATYDAPEAESPPTSYFMVKRKIGEKDAKVSGKDLGYFLLVSSIAPSDTPIVGTRHLRPPDVYMVSSFMRIPLYRTTLSLD
ncbi:hypothetical protein KM043_011309 [Ampulex compressa]|nr:hypothetical protein KM043_011309 [Ampulex compressa]